MSDDVTAASANHEPIAGKREDVALQAAEATAGSVCTLAANSLPAVGIKR